MHTSSALSDLPEFGDLIQHRTVAYLNGQSAYLDGTLPCDHISVFDYPDCIRTMHTTKNATNHIWTVYPKMAPSGIFGDMVPTGNTFESICTLVERYGA